MSEVELLLVNSSDSCTMYTIQFMSDDMSEFEKFIDKFRKDAELNPDFQAIMRFVEQILSNGALERYFRREGKMLCNGLAEVRAVAQTGSAYRQCRDN